MEGESAVIGIIIYDFHSLDIQHVQMEEESGVTRSNIDAFPYSDIHGDEMDG